MKKPDAKERSYDFALRIIKLAQELPKNIAGVSLGKQLIRAGTSIGANVEEAQAGFSKKDFTYKMSIARKEARETRYWLNLIKDSGLITDAEGDSLIQEAR